METKHFIKIGSQYLAKNKLQKLLIERLKAYNGVLTDSLDVAKNRLFWEIKGTVQEYRDSGGKAQDPGWSEYAMTDDAVGIQIPDVLSIGIYPVTGELSERGWKNQSRQSTIHD